ncbi:unnamed protein product [Tenebrio molitor]|nr:unnamed protein product [Tenebrio molitor]
MGPNAQHFFTYVAPRTSFSANQSCYRWSQDVASAFGNIVCVQFATSVIVLCETLVMLSLTTIFSATYFMLLSYQTAIFIQIFLYCWFGNEVTIKSAMLNSATYNWRWYNYSSSYKKDLMFFMHRTQKPIVLLVGNIFPINLNTFTSILRSSWAYFMALRSVHEMQ